MTLPRVQLIMERRTTDHFIDADPSLIILQKVEEVADGAGGRTHVNVPRLPQKARVIPARTRSTSLTYNLPNGQVVSSKDSLLVGPYNLIVEANDWFQFGEVAYQVTFIEPDREIQTLCQLDLLGKSLVESI